MLSHDVAIDPLIHGRCDALCLYRARNQVEAHLSDREVLFSCIVHARSQMEGSLNNDVCPLELHINQQRATNP